MVILYWILTLFTHIGSSKTQEDSCFYIVQLLDHGSDGWGDNHLSVYVDDQEALLITLSDYTGSQLDDDFPYASGGWLFEVPNGGNISFRFHNNDPAEAQEFSVVFWSYDSTILATYDPDEVRTMGDSKAIEVLAQAQCPERANCLSATTLRREWRDLTDDEKDIYLNAVNTFHQRGGYGFLIRKHFLKYDFASAHGDPAFFPWHRMLLYELEILLRQLTPESSCLSLPYWDWTEDYGDKEHTEIMDGSLLSEGSVTQGKSCIQGGAFDHLQHDMVLPGDTPGENACVTRKYDDSIVLTGPAYMEYQMQKHSDYHTWWPSAEIRPHGTVHKWIGGDFSKSFSIVDPIFFLHHANVDRIWALWQDCHDYDLISVNDLTYQHYSGPLDEPLHGFIQTPRDAYNILKLGYRYDTSTWHRSQRFRSCRRSNGSSSLDWFTQYPETRSNNPDISERIPLSQTTVIPTDPAKAEFPADFENVLNSQSPLNLENPAKKSETPEEEEDEGMPAAKETTKTNVDVASAMSVFAPFMWPPLMTNSLPRHTLRSSQERRLERVNNAFDSELSVTGDYMHALKYAVAVECAHDNPGDVQNHIDKFFNREGWMHALTDPCLEVASMLDPESEPSQETSPRSSSLHPHPP